MCPQTHIHTRARASVTCPIVQHAAFIQKVTILCGCLAAFLRGENPHHRTSRLIVQLLSEGASLGMTWKLKGNSRWKRHGEHAYPSLAKVTNFPVTGQLSGAPECFCPGERVSSSRLPFSPARDGTSFLKGPMTPHIYFKGSEPQHCHDSFACLCPHWVANT